jgi:PAS domain S-box-containing protein
MSSSAPSPTTVLSVFDALDSPGTPLTTPDVADEFDCTNRTIYNKLETLVADGSIETKKVGARGRVWWQPPTNHAGDGDAPSVMPDETTGRPTTDRVLAEQQRLVEQIASGTPLEECLSSLCTAVSTLDPTVRASIVLTDDANQSFERCIAPDLSPAWRKELEGLPIDDQQIGTCGEAVFRGEPITCENVATDDRWTDDWRELCRANDIRAGHSVPIHDADGEPLGSVMLCFDEPKQPTEWEQLAEFGTHVASIAIERDRSRRALRDAEERQRLALDAGEMGVWDLDLQTNELSDRSPRHDEIFGYEEPREDWSLDTFLDHVHEDDRERIEQSFEDAFETGEWTFECRIIRADDEQRWIAAQGEFDDDEEDKPVRAVGTVEDITERKERERDLDQYRAVTQAVNDAIITIDETSTIRSVNPGVADIFGYDPEELVGERLTVLMPDDLTDRHLSAFGNYLASGERTLDWDYVEMSGCHRDGSEIPLALSFSEVEHGGERLFTGVVRDVTERKQRERELEERTDELEEARNQLEAATEAGSIGLWSWRIQEDHLTADKFVAECYGMDPETAATGTSLEAFLDAVHEDDRERMAREIETAVEDTGALDAEYRVRNADGEVTWLLARGETEYAADSEPLRLQGAIDDITERKETEQELRTVVTRLKAQKEAFQAAAGGAPLEESLTILLRTAMDKAESDVKAAFYGVDDDGSCLHPIAATSAMPDAYIRAIDNLEIGADSLACGLAAHTGEPVLTRDVTEESRWDPLLHLAEEADFRGCWSFPIETVAGDVVGTLAMYHRDPREATPRDRELAGIVTQAAAIIISRHNESEERKEAEQALRESEERLRLATNAAEMGVWELDCQTNDFTDRSPQHNAIFGSEDREDWSLDTFLDYVHPDDRDQVAASFETALQTGDWTVDCRITRADDKQRWISINGEFYDDEEGEPVRAVGTVQDITERKERERELREQSKLEEYGAFVRAVEDYAIFMLDPDGDITSWNDGAERIKGYTADDIVGEHVSAFYTDADIDEGVPETNLETAAAEGRVEDEGWRVRKDGSRFWADVVITAIRDDDGTLQGFTKVTRDRTEQREYEQQLRQERDLTEQIFETVPVGICSITSDGDFGRANQRALTCIGCEASDLAEYNVDSWDLYDAEGDPIPTDEWPWTRVTDTGEPVDDYQCQVELPDRGRRWFSLNAAPLYDEQSDDQSGEASKTVVALEDITDRKRANNALEHLTTTSRELMDADLQTITEQAAGITQEVLDVPYASLWRYDEATGDLQRHTASTAAGIDAASIRPPEEFVERAWETFVSTELDASNELPPASECASSEESIRSGVIVPLGRHGVICVGSLSSGAFDETTVDLAETVAATIETALDRAADEQALAHQNEELTRLDRINSILREIDQVLVEAESREEIDRVVCEQLSESELYEFAWIGEADPGTDTIVPREWASIDPGYLDQLTITTDETPTGQGPIGTALRTRESQVVPDIITAARFAPWREHTLNQDVRSCLSIPLVYNDVLYGVLTVYAEQPLTNERHHDVVAELGETVANAISSAETKQALQTDSVVELSVQVREPDTILSRLAQEVSGQIEFEGLVSHSAETAQVFITTRGASPDEIRAAATDSLAIETMTTLSESEDGCRFKLVMDDPPLASVLIDQDAEIRQLTFDADGATAVVNLPATRDVRPVIETVQSTFPEMELVSRRTHPRSHVPLHTFRAAYKDCLTARQQETLRTAYLSGFFESPRGITGQELADTMDVAQSTFVQHLRAGQRNLFETLFDGSE